MPFRNLVRLCLLQGNWYHQVFNLDNTVALTENYLNHTNYETVEKYLIQHKREDVLQLLNMLKAKFLNKQAVGH